VNVPSLSLGEMHQLLVGEISQSLVMCDVFRSFSGLARPLNSLVHRPASKTAGEKRRVQMSSQSPFTRTLVAIAAALFMSTVAVGAAVGPASAIANPSEVNANA